MVVSFQDNLFVKNRILISLFFSLIYIKIYLNIAYNRRTFELIP